MTTQNPYSGPAWSYSTIGNCEAAYWRMVNDTGGINGRTINYISLDDGYSSPKTVEIVRQLVEEDHVLCCFNTLQPIQRLSLLKSPSG
jgi:ABC-type branched-subunit amino acid transport system substrate-binding protein